MKWEDMTERQREFFSNLEVCTDYSLDTLVWAWEHIDDWLDGNEGRDVYGADLGFEITLNENNDGFVDDPCTYNAKEWIREHFDDCAVYWEYERFEFGGDGNKVNPFDEPVKYQTLIYINTVEQIINSLPYIDGHWNDSITLTPDVIARLRYELCMTDEEPVVEETDNDNSEETEDE